MTGNNLSLSQAAARFLEKGTKDTSENQGEVLRFVRWYGADRPLTQLRGHEVSLYAENFGATKGAARKLNAVKLFLSFLKSANLTSTNLGPHLRLKRPSGGARRKELSQPTPDKIQMTCEGEQEMKEELASLVSQRPAVAEEIRLAAHDKDFRENAPLHAARDKQGHIESRIREIEAALKYAVITDSRHGSRVKLGHSVLLRNLSSGNTLRYTIVGPAEANAANGKISSVSPVGQALLEQVEGTEVKVAAPKGTLRFRIEKIDG